MVNYENGKIYKIVCNETNDVYIGSTVEKLSVRMSKHRAHYKRYQAGKRSYITSFEILKYPSAKILLVRNCPCDSKEELHAIEGNFIRNNECVNKVIPGRTSVEYYQDNSEQIKQKVKQYRQSNSEQIKQKVKQYRKDNADLLRERQRKYRQANNEELKKKKNKKYNCECGGRYIHNAMAQHFRSIKHIEFEKEQEIEFCKIFGITPDL